MIRDHFYSTEYPSIRSLKQNIRNYIREFPLEDWHYYNIRMIRRVAFWLFYLFDKHDLDAMCRPDLFEAKYNIVRYIHKNHLFETISFRQNPYDHAEYEYRYLSDIVWSHDYDGYGEYIEVTQ
jgi:hypothetical protein